MLVFVLINCGMGFEVETLTELKKIKDVLQAFRIYGVYDLIVKVSVYSLDDVKEIIQQRIRTLNHVHSTLTMIVSKIEK